MVPEELLTICINAVEAGEEPTQVAARYPEYAADLEPLLKAVVMLRNTPKPTMSGVAFVAGRRALSEAAQQAAALKAALSNSTSSQASPQTWTSQLVDGTHPTESVQLTGATLPPELDATISEQASAGQRHGEGEEEVKAETGFPAETLATSGIGESAPNDPLRSGPITPDLPPRGTAERRRSFLLPSILSGLAVAAVVLLVVVIAVSNSGSLPGDSLYTLKRTGESLQRLILRTAGDEASWYADQVVRRLGEAVTLEAQGETVDPELLAEISENTNAALMAVNDLPTSERARFLLDWQQELDALEAQAADESQTTQFLAETTAAVTNALDLARTPPTVLPLLATETATATMTPTASPTAPAETTATPRPTSTSVPTGASIVAPTVAEEDMEAAESGEPTVAPTRTATRSTVTATSVPNQITIATETALPTMLTPLAIPTLTPNGGATTLPTPTWTTQAGAPLPPIATPVPGSTATPIRPAATPTAPRVEPTVAPTVAPTRTPTVAPTVAPTRTPTSRPTSTSTSPPTIEPTETATSAPTRTPTLEPVEEPTATPIVPTVEPTATSTVVPTIEPTETATSVPTLEPTAEPTEEPTLEPTVTPTEEPTGEPTVGATVVPTAAPTVDPTENPTQEPTLEATVEPTAEATSTSEATPDIPPEVTEEPTEVVEEPTVTPAGVETEPTTEPTEESSVPPFGGSEPIPESTIEEPTPEQTPEPTSEPEDEAATEPDLSLPLSDGDTPTPDATEEFVEEENLEDAPDEEVTPEAANLLRNASSTATPQLVGLAPRIMGDDEAQAGQANAEGSDAENTPSPAEEPELALAATTQSNPSQNHSLTPNQMLASLAFTNTLTSTLTPTPSLTLVPLPTVTMTPTQTSLSALPTVTPTLTPEIAQILE